MPDRLAFTRWLATSNAYSFLDDAVLGCLEQSYAEEVASDFGFDLGNTEQRREFRRAIDAALCEGL